MSAERRSAWLGFAARGVGWIAMFLALLWGAGELARAFYPWRPLEDPRKRLLTSGQCDGSPVVLLGDSVFSSYYVDRDDQTLWRQLESKLGRPVFPGALNSARPADFVNEARVVAASWPRGTVVVVDVLPSRLLRTTTADEENWRGPLGRWVWLPPHDASPLERVEHRLRYLLERPLLFWSVLVYLRDNPPEVSEAFHDRVWSEPGSFAEGRFADFRGEYESGPPELHPTPWVGELLEVVEAAGFRPVVVVTPMNHDLVTAWMPTPESAAAMRADFARARASFSGRLRDRGVEALDLDGLVPSRCFADLFHPNVCGEEIVAGAVDGFIRRRGW